MPFIQVDLQALNVAGDLARAAGLRVEGEVLTEEEANAYGERMSREDPDGPRHEWHVGPCLLTIQTRDNIDVPVKPGGFSMTTKPPPRLNEVLAAFDDDALLKMMLGQFAEGFPDFASGGERMMAVADRARSFIRHAVELHDALAKVDPDAARMIMADAHG